MSASSSHHAMFPTVQMTRRREKHKPIPVSAIIVDFEKRRDAVKYYMYHIEVTLSDGKSYIIFRTYNQFHQLHQLLEEKYPVEAGLFEEKYKVLPDLPGKVFTGRGGDRDVPLRKFNELNKFLKCLLSLEPHISQDCRVQQFLSLREGDISAPVHIYENRLHHLVTEAVDARSLVEKLTLKDDDDDDDDEVSEDEGKPQPSNGIDAQPAEHNILQGNHSSLAGLLPTHCCLPKLVVCHYQNIIRKLEIRDSPIRYDGLLSMLRKEFRNPYLVINYKDQHNDLVRVSNQDELDLMLYYKGQGLIQLYLMNDSDVSVYNVKPRCLQYVESKSEF